MMNKKHSIQFDRELNSQQLTVVQAGQGPILAIAGAGSGKTRTITYRVAHLIESGIDPHRILLLTFTNKAAREMLKRVESIIPYDVNKIWGGTFHHIANRILRIHGNRLGFEPNYTILDQSDALDLLNTCLKERWDKPKEGLVPQGTVLSNIISLARNTRTALNEILELRYPYFLDYIEDIESIEKHYKEKKRGLNLMDFDDLLCVWLSLMEEYPAIKDFYAQRFEYVLVDEYQDTNKLQADIIDTLASHHRNVMVVGDDAQSIYAFRGANYYNIIEFPQRYPDAKVYKLEYNYRSSPQILNLANEIITCNQKQFHKVLKPAKDDGDRPVLMVPDNVYDQAEFVTDRIQECISKGIPPEEIAVLYRAHFHSMELQMELNRQAVPFEVRSGIRFFEQSHIKDIVAYLKVLTNPYDETAWKRILKLLPGIGEKTSQKIFNFLAASKDPLGSFPRKDVETLVPRGAKPYWENFSRILVSLTQMEADVTPAALIKTSLENGYSDYLRSRYVDSARRNEDIEQFIEFAWQYELSGDLLSELALMTGSDPAGTEDGLSPEKVTLSTIHQAKGLEWSVVFIIWLTEGRFPNPNNFESLEDEEEERRLFYVAVTRAKDYLCFCAPATIKNSSGYISTVKSSRFLREIPEEYYNKTGSAYEYRNY